HQRRHQTRQEAQPKVWGERRRACSLFLRPTNPNLLFSKGKRRVLSLGRQRRPMRLTRGTRRESRRRRKEKRKETVEKRKETVALFLSHRDLRRGKRESPLLILSRLAQRPSSLPSRLLSAQRATRCLL